MVAYSFKGGFVPLITYGEKRQTIRAFRARHAQPGEMLQLFTGMRTRHCRKIIPDVPCIGVDEIIMPAGCWYEGSYEPITVNGIPVMLDELEAFAIADGFRPGRQAINDGQRVVASRSARSAMATFWRLYHGPGRFEGVVIRWDPSGVLP